MTDHPTDQLTDHELVPLDVAADRLGITVNAVRQRLKRGTLTGHKTAGGWLVDWRPTTNLVGDHATTDQPTTPVSRRPTTTDHVATEAIGALRDILAEERAALVEERAKVERLVEATAVWQVRAIQAEERLKQLTAGDHRDRADDEVSGVPHADSARPGATGEVTERPQREPKPDHEPIGPVAWRRASETHRESVITALWRRLFGR